MRWSPVFCVIVARCEQCAGICRALLGYMQSVGVGSDIVKSNFPLPDIKKTE
jgi:hypothetical protein